MEITVKHELTELSDLAKPLADYLKSNFNPHFSIVITDKSVRVESTEMCSYFND